VTAAPSLANVALQFSSYEYFWLVLLGLTCAIFIASDNVLKGLVSLLIGLLIATVGMENPAAFPRFTFEEENLIGGVTLIPMMVGLFAVSEVLRYVTSIERPLQLAQEKDRQRLQRAMGPGQEVPDPGAARQRPGYADRCAAGRRCGHCRVDVLRGFEEILQGASEVRYRPRRRHNRERRANNSALSGAWIPALVFGIPGDSITAIAIGVLYLKNMNPGPTIFINNPENIYAVFIVFFLANLLMLPLGVLAIKSYKQVLRMPRAVLMPVILVFCTVGAFAINNTPFDIGVMLAFGLLAFFMEASGFPGRTDDPRRRARTHVGGELHHLDDQGRRQLERVLLATGSPAHSAC